jgi:predicted ATPase
VVVSYGLAGSLTTRSAAPASHQPEIVAHHFTEAGLVDPAIDYWLKAGHLALSRSANAEAVKHLGQGIELIQRLCRGVAAPQGLARLGEDR